MSSNAMLTYVTIFILTLQTYQHCQAINYRRNYDSRYTNSDIPEWKQRACEKAQTNKANSHYHCDEKGNVKCMPGWQGDLCQVPMCRRGCDPMNGYCQRPGECRCRIGYTGELCDKCIPLPGCQHGYCNKPFECLCKPGWDGLFCTEPTCRQGCHSTRGYCEAPGECRCRIGWAGRNCSDCSVLPGCQHGTCSKPLECQCLPGYTGLLCQTAICSADCHKQHGYCRKPGECRCKVGWTDANCDKCFPYPGCVNGDCTQPWECNCRPGWGGMLCDEKLTYCEEHPKACENEGKCISLTKADGSYQCSCKQGYLGKNCEIVDEFMLTSTAPPRITPPTITELSKEETTTPKGKDAANVKKPQDSSKATAEKPESDDEDDEDDDDEEYEYEDDDEEDDEDVESAQKSKNANLTEIVTTTQKTNILPLKTNSAASTLNQMNATNSTNSAEVLTPTSTTTTTTKLPLTKPATKEVPKFKDFEDKMDRVDDKPKVTVTNLIDDDGFARRRNSGGSSFVFPSAAEDRNDHVDFHDNIANFETIFSTGPDIVGTATGL